MTDYTLRLLKDAKRDDRPQKGAWAPGNYMCVCCGCGASFIGDKRAHNCADCAYPVTGGIVPDSIPLNSII